MNSGAKKLSVLFCGLTLGSLLFVNIYPTGDWMTAPLATMAFGFPLLVLQILLTILTFRQSGSLRLIVVIQAILALLCIYFMYYYVLTHQK